MSEYPETGFSLEKLIQQGNGPEKAKRLLEDIAVSVEHRESEVWRYQPDLSYFPDGSD